MQGVGRFDSFFLCIKQKRVTECYFDTCLIFTKFAALNISICQIQLYTK